MKSHHWPSILLTVPLASALDCSTSAFRSFLPSNARITSATSIPENGTFLVSESNIAYPVSPTQLKALCAIQVNVTSSPTSEYSFGLFLPQDWNGRFLAVGNGGFAGGVNWLDMGVGVRYGFATMSTDTGHTSLSDDLSWSLHATEKKIDWGYRAMHGSVEQAKSIVESVYGSRPEYSYYSGCSTGGRQGLKEIQMFPEDFDAALVGAPAWWTSHLQTWTVKVALYNLPVTAAHHIPPALFPIVGKEVMRQCDAVDGLVDHVISDPRRCHFLPDRLLCGPKVTNQTAAECLTAPQIDTLHNIYNDYVETNQTFVFPHLELGSEEQWEVLLGSSEPSNLGQQYVSDFLLGDPDWDFYDFDYSIVELADATQPGNATANDFDLSPFHARGGKLMHYHGLADALIPTGSSDYFYHQVHRALAAKGIELDNWYRFFLVPGMQHCAGTPADVNAPWYFAGANQAGRLDTSLSGVPGFEDAEHDALLALMRWTENGTAPDQIIATKWRNDTTQDAVLRQRPICPFPQQAKHRDGDPNQAGSWECQSHCEVTTPPYH